MNIGTSGGVVGGIRKKPRGLNLGLQWWRKLTLPRRGKKDSKLRPPLPSSSGNDGDGGDAALTDAQQLKLIERRQMLKKSLLAPRVTRLKHLCEVDWDGDDKVGIVQKAKGGILQSMGYFRRGGTHCLYSEEVLFLMDKGSMQLSWHGLPVSVQHAWSMCLVNLNATHYLVYAHLRRAGYVVRRRGDVGGGTAKRKRWRDDDDSDDDNENINGKRMDEDGGVRDDDDGTTKTEEMVSWSVWRCGSFKRNDFLAKPSFNVIVFPYHQQNLPRLVQLAQSTLQSFYNRQPPPQQHDDDDIDQGNNTDNINNNSQNKENHTSNNNNKPKGKNDRNSATNNINSTGASPDRTRTRLALVDRGIVTFVDIASNATPLSARFVNRLDGSARAHCHELQSGDASSVFACLKD